jgi:hypothetical protein
MKLSRPQFLNVMRAGVGRALRSPWAPFVALFILSLAIRTYQLLRIPAVELIPTAERELGAIAISLMKTGQFADAYRVSTGPTAHLPPLYPFILSLIYRCFGLTIAAGYASRLLIILTGSLLFAMLPWLAHWLGLGRLSGFMGGLAGAVLVDWPEHGEYLVAIFLGLLLVAFLQRWTTARVSWQGSLLLGLAIGAVFHLQPALLPVMLGCMAFELWWRRRKQKWVFLAATGLGIVLACAPWAWRNYTTFHALFFIRSNFGLELRMGNHAGAAATMEEMDAQLNGQQLHPTLLYQEASLLRDIGEIEYMHRAGQEALDWINTHPGDFLWLSLQRFSNLWAGQLQRPLAAAGVLALTILSFWGLWRTFPSLTIPQRAALIIPLAAYPVIYYFVAYMPRYRIPIDWILFMLAGALVSGWIRQIKTRWMVR